MERKYLICERHWVFTVLMFASGILGSYTYILCGNVFCNAQTGNVVLMGMALGSGQWWHGLYYLIPIMAYILGAVISELAHVPVKNMCPLRWETLLIFIEILVVLLLGLLPQGTPVQIYQISVNFIASLQYNTFRKAEGIPLATTFATNHIRQIGVGMAQWLQHRRSNDKSHRKKFKNHGLMLLSFFLGTLIGAVFCHHFGQKGLWIILVPYIIVAVALLRADLFTEKDLKSVDSFES